MTTFLFNSAYQRLKNGLVTFIVFTITSIALFPATAFAEGTTEVSPSGTTANGICALAVWPFRASGSYFNAPAENRISFYINNTSERFYYGFHFNSGFGNTAATDVYVRIFNAAGTLVSGPTLLPSTAANGYISTYAQAAAGPNIGATTTGYNPLTFTPTAVGEYYIEIYRSTNGTAQTTPTYNNVISSPYFDMTVASVSGGVATKYPGRVFSKKWGFMTVSETPNFTASATATSEPAFYSYSLDSTIVKIKFNSGFKPIAFDVVTNSYGVSTTGTWDVARNSAYSAASPSLPNGYKLFFNTPDAALYPVPAIPALPTLASPAVIGCSPPYTIRFNMPAAGDARILLNLDGVAGYQVGVDRLLEVFNVAPGLNTTVWDGRNGAGTLVSNGITMSVNAIYQRGRFNLPIYDAEVNKSGFSVSAVAPLASANIPLYWNDANLTVFGTCSGTGDNENNATGPGLNNTLLGTTSSNAHSWNGDGNIAQANPAPASSPTQEDDNLQCNDFGNVRTINSWGWALQSTSNNFTVTFGCYSINGNVYHDANGLTDTTVNANSTPTTPIPTGMYANLVGSDGLVVNTVAVAAGGTYSFPNVTSGTYSIVLSSNSTPTATPVAPTLWAFTGEFLGTGKGSDGTPNGILTNVVVTNATLNNANFGIELKPVGTATSMSTQSYNPLGTQVPAAQFTPTDSDGTVTSIRITAFPTGAASITVNGTTYTNTNFPTSTGITIPATAGQPTQAIYVVPATPTTSVIIPYLPRDNGGIEGTTAGSVTIPFANSGLSISGNVWNDANGNGIKSATEPLVAPANSGETLYAVLVQTNKTVSGVPVVLSSVAVSATTGYSFSDVPSGNNYEVRIVSKTAAPATGTTASTVTANLATNWIGVATSNNGTITTGLSTNALVNTLNSFTTTTAAVNFGIERKPMSNSATYSISTPTGNSSRALTSANNMGALSGNDAEDSTMGAGKTVVITSVAGMNGNQLFYNNALMSAGSVITSYDPNLLTIRFSGTGAQQAVFNFSFRDAANQTSTTPATYTITWSSPLPLQLTSFTATAAKDNVLLNWETVNEKDVDGFNIEHSTNARDWSLAGNVKATGNDHYAFTDHAAANGTNYYRLKITDLDGSFTYSSQLAIAFNQKAGVSIYPNPATDKLFVTGDLTGIETIYLSDLGGKTVSRIVAPYTQGIDVSGLATGSYLLTITGKNGNNYSFKVFKQ